MNFDTKKIIFFKIGCTTYKIITYLCSEISMREVLSSFINRFNYCEMKKLVLLVAVVVAVSLSACKKAAQEEIVIPEEEVITVVEELTGEEVVEVIEVTEEVTE